MRPSIRALAGAALLSPACVDPAAAQAVPSPCAAMAASDAAQVPSLVIAAGTPVEFEFAAPLDSRTNKIDDFFAIRLTRPILSGERVAVPAGAMGFGQIVHAAKAGGGGKAGELIVAVRGIDAGGVRVPLRRYRDGGIGADNRNGAFGVGLVVPFGAFLVRGGEKIIAAGARGNAIVAADTLVAPMVSGTNESNKGG